MSGRLDRVKDLEGLAESAGFSVSGLAREVQCTPRHLRRCIAKRFGMTAEHWMREIRLRKAAGELLNGEEVKNASANAGYKPSLPTAL